MIRYKKLFIGSVCNNQCVTCPNTGERQGRPLEDILSEMGSPEGSIDSLELHGGEPSIRHDIDTIIGQAKERGWRRIKTLTNARVFSKPEAAIAVMQAGARVFDVKLCGNEPRLHDALTRSEGSFVETVRGISNLKNIQRPQDVKVFVGVRVPVNAANSPYLPAIVVSAMQLHVDRITLSFDDANARMGEVARSAKAAIATGLVNSLWVQTEGIPLCMMGEYEHHVSEVFATDDRARDRREPCGSCAFTTCEGVWTDYLEAQGSTELVAVLESVHADRTKGDTPDG